MHVNIFKLITISNKNYLYITLCLQIILFITTKAESSAIDAMLTSINSNFTEINSTISSNAINTYLTGYLNSNTTTPGVYPVNLTTNTPSVFKLLNETKQEFQNSNMTLNSINAIANINANIYAESLFDSYLITPKITLSPINQNYYLNFNYSLASNKYLATDTAMKAGVNFAMITNNLLHPYSLSKTTAQSDNEWLQYLSSSWSMIAQNSISYHILHTSLKKRLIIEKLGAGLSVSNTNVISEDTSYAELEEYQNLKRTHTPEWSDTIEQSTEVILYRELLFAYAELARTLTIQYRQGQEILAAISGKISGQAGYVSAARSIVSPETDVDISLPTEPIAPDVPETPTEPTTLPPPETTSSSPSSGASFCFISSFVFGENAPETLILRQFRDNYLLNSTIGTNLTDMYYIVSPDIIKLTGQEPAITSLCKRYLTRFIKIII
jgi:hypothetical protein